VSAGPKLTFDNANDYLEISDCSVLINETACADLTIGLCINQGANDDQIITCKSSDVAHLGTGIAEADTFFSVEKLEDTSGGAQLRGFKDADGGAYGGIVLDGYLSEDANTTHSQTGRAITEAWGRQLSGGSVTNTVADGNVFAVRTRRGDASTTLFIIDEDGDLFADGGTSTTNMVTLFDAYADAELARAFDLARSPEQVIKTRWDDYVRYNEETLVEAGILGAPLSEGGLVNVTRLQQLHNGALWQNHCKIREMEERIVRYERALIALGADQAVLEGE
jgi:hypothetical protein